MEKKYLDLEGYSVNYSTINHLEEIQLHLLFTASTHMIQAKPVARLINI